MAKQNAEQAQEKAKAKQNDADKSEVVKAKTNQTTESKIENPVYGINAAAREWQKFMNMKIGRDKALKSYESSR